MKNILTNLSGKISGAIHWARTWLTTIRARYAKNLNALYIAIGLSVVVLVVLRFCESQDQKTLKKAKTIVTLYSDSIDVNREKLKLVYKNDSLLAACDSTHRATRYALRKRYEQILKERNEKPPLNPNPTVVELQRDVATLYNNRAR